jgi:hypothetical protein
MSAIITPRKYGSLAAIKRALGKISAAEVPQDEPMGFKGDSAAHPSLRAVHANAVGPALVPSLRQPDLDAEDDDELDGQGAPIPGNPSYPVRRTPKNPTRSGF